MSGDAGGAGTSPGPGPAGRPPRALGTRDVLALGVNCVVGSGIFLLPGLAAARLGPASILAVVAAGVLACLVALCFAEAAARFRSSGGAYLYARAAFGDLAGFEVGWLSALAGTVAWGALAAGFAAAVSVLAPAAGREPARSLLVVGFVAFLGWINLRGARPGARLSNLFTAAKLLTLVLFVAAGAFAVDAGSFRPFAPQGTGAFAGTTLLVLYAYVGFENLVVPAGDMAAPERSLPVGILVVMGTVTLLYAAAQAVVVGTLGTAAAGENAVARAAQGFLGSAGGVAVAAGVVVSIFGVNAASSLILPRRVSALAEQGDLPAAFGRLHPRYGTPWVAVVTVHAVVAVVAVSGSFAELAVLAVVGRLIQYVPTCLAVLVLRRRPARVEVADPAGGEGGRFRLPGGATIPALALALSVVLLLQATPFQLAVGAGGALAGLPVYRLVRRSRRASLPSGPLPRPKIDLP
jgi:amino acid transporter